MNIHVVRSVKGHCTVDSDGPYCCSCLLWSKSTEGLVWLCCTGECISGRCSLWVHYECAALENASVADVHYEYTMSVLHWRMHQWQMFSMSTLWVCCTGECISGRCSLWVQLQWTRQNDSSKFIGHIIEHVLLQQKNKIPLYMPNQDVKWKRN